MLTMIFALFSIFTSLRVSSSTADAQGMITAISSVGCLVGPVEYPYWFLQLLCAVQVSPGVCLDKKRVRERRKNSNSNSNSKREEKGEQGRFVFHNNKFFSHSSFALENPSFAIWVNWASKSSCRSINNPRWSVKFVRLISLWMLNIKYDTKPQVYKKVKNSHSWWIYYMEIA